MSFHRAIVNCAVALAIGALVAACDDPFSTASGPPTPPPPPEVAVVTLAAQDVPISFEYPGRVAGVREVEVRARVGGIILKRTYNEGQHVNEGDQLFLIDPEPYEAALAKAKAQLEQEQARMLQAERNWTRVSGLYQKNAVSARDRDEAQASFQLGRASVALAQAELRTAAINLGYTKVTAPVGGMTSTETVSEGSLVGTDANASLLTRITQLDPVYVNFAISDGEAGFIRHAIADGRLRSINGKQLTVAVRTGDGGRPVQTGIVDFTASTIDMETGSVRARALVENKDDELVPGQFVRIVVGGLIQPAAIVIPTAALMQGAQGAFVFLVDGKGMVEARPVRIAREVESGWIVETGVRPGERVIVEGVMKARPGQPVRVADTAGTSPAPGAVR